MAEQCDWTLELIQPDELESVSKVTREIIENRLMSVLLDKYAKHADVINSAKELNKMCGFNAPVTKKLTGANGEPLFPTIITQQDIDRARLISAQLDAEF